MQDPILEATVQFLRTPKNLELALRVEKTLLENGETAVQDIVLQTTEAFISGSDNNREMARRVTEAMPFVRR